MNAISLGIKNKIFTYFARMNNTLDFNPKKLDIRKVGREETCIYYTDYDSFPFYLVIDNLKGYFNEPNIDNKYLTMIFTSQAQKVIYTKIWEEIKKVINKADNTELDNYSKDYGVIKFDSDNVLPLDFVINIRSLTIVIKSVFRGNGKFYPQIYLDYCLYNKV